MVLRDDDDVYWRRDVERRLSQLEGAPQAGFQSITEGGMVVSQAGAQRIVLGIIGGLAALVFYDATGHETVRLGELPGAREGMEVYDGSGDPAIRAGELQSGGYGLEAIQAGDAVPLAALSFGVQVAQNQSLGYTTSTSFGDLTGGGAAGTPTVTVNVSETGRLLLTASTIITNVDPGEQGEVSFELSGANTFGAALVLGMVINGPTNSDLITVQTSGSRLMTGLNPGATTVTLKYRSASGGIVSFGDRVLSAFPL